jgi:hypothetical protein
VIAQRFNRSCEHLEICARISGPAGIQQKHTTPLVISFLDFRNPVFGGESLEDRVIG